MVQLFFASRDIENSRKSPRIASQGVLNIEKGRQIMMPDILFVLRSQIKLLIRICRNSKILDGKAHMRGRRAAEVEQSLDIIDFKNRLRNTLDTNVDPLKTDRLQREGNFYTTLILL